MEKWKRYNQNCSRVAVKDCGTDFLDAAVMAVDKKGKDKKIQRFKKCSKLNV